jgi:hypothetical protein
MRVLRENLLAAWLLFGFSAQLGAQRLIQTAVGEGSGGLPGFGHSLAAVGDVDLDGVADYAVGAPYEASCGRSAGGQVKIFSGLTGTPLFPPLADCENGYYGMSVAGIGDVNGDGHPDVAIGAPYIAGVGQGRPGVAAVRSGLDGAQLFHRSGGAPHDMFGTSVAGAGDVDLDGFPDWAVGATQNGETPEGPGYVRVFSGATGATIRALAGNTGYGASLVGAGDVNLDGYPDLLVGANRGRGKAQMRSGQNGAILWTRFATSTSQYARFGTAVDAAGDVDDDGLSDLVVGAAGISMASVLRAHDGALLFDLAGPVGDYFGGAVAGIGDIDHDGHDDLAIGAKWADGFAGLFSPGAVWIYSGRTQRVLRSFLGNATGDLFGLALASVGDLDQDGMSDLAIGANQAGNGGPGFVEIYSLRLWRPFSGPRTPR